MTDWTGAGVALRRRRTVRASVAIALGIVVLLLAAGLGWRMTRGVAEFGDAAPSSTTLSPPGPPVAAAGIPIAAGGLPRVDAVVPVRLEIPAIRVTAPIQPVGLHRETREINLPGDGDIVGWYQYGPGLRSTAGSITIAGHVDTAAGEGALFRLGRVPAGAVVTITGSDGAVRSFTVVAREVFAKTSMPMDRLFARDGPVRLTLITCGGSFDAKARQYRDNIVLTAIPA